jgi:hypothetical protein
MNQKYFQAILKEAIKDGGKLTNKSHDRINMLDYLNSSFHVQFAWWFDGNVRRAVLINGSYDKARIVADSWHIDDPEYFMPVLIRDNRISRMN